MIRLEITLLGGFRAAASSDRPLAVPTRKAQALLAYLAVPPGQAHPRDKLASLLWGDMAEGQARANLRQAIASLRRLLGDALQLDADALGLDRETVAVDVDRFERRVADGTPDALAEAADLYRGDFLAGLALREPPFEEWLVAERERLREMAIETLARLLRHHRETGHPEAAVQMALRILGLDPLQEAVHRTLMRLYVELGRRPAALRQYQTCVTVLDRELRIAPEAETKALYEEILRARPGAARPAIGAAVAARAPESSTRDIPLVGRAPELARLTRILDAALGSRGHAVRILGDPGVGKSRLAAEVVALAAARGARVLVGRCYETENRLPFGAWVDALRAGGVVTDRPLVEELGPVWRGELSRLLPELATATVAAREPSEPLHLFEAVTQLVARLVARQPLVVLIEDWHWVDEMSLRLMPVLARRIEGWPVLILSTARDDETAGSALHRQIDDELMRERVVVRMRLAPLGREETVALAERLLPVRSAPALGEEVWRASEGNAFMAVETARALAERGPTPTASAPDLPAGVRHLVESRIERLSEPARRLVGVAAVIGRQFEFDLLHRSAGLTETDAAVTMEELIRRRIFHQSGEGFEFTHDRIREVAYTGLLSPHRKVLHRHVAVSLEAIHGAESAEVAGALASHFRAAGEWDRAVEHLARFGEQAARGYAHAEAAQAFGQALDALVHLPPSPPRDRRQLGLTQRRAHSLYFLGQWAESADILARETALLSRAGDPALAAPWHAWLGHIYARLGQHERARGSARRAIDEAARAGDDASAGKAWGVLSLESYWSGDAADGIAQGERAAALLEGTAERWWLGMAHFYTAMNHIHRGELGRARAALARANAVGEAIGDNRLQCYAAWTAGWSLALGGERAAAAAACERGIALATDQVSAAYASAFLGVAELEAGEASAAAARFAVAIEQFERFRFSTFEAWFTALLAEARRLEENLDSADDLAARAVARGGEAGWPFAVAWARRVQGRVAGRRGDRAAAESLLADAHAQFERCGAALEAARTRLDLADVATALGDLADARAWIRSAHETFTALDLRAHVAAADAREHAADRGA